MGKRVELSEAAKYYATGSSITDEAIEDVLRNTPKAIVHGGRATNAYLPPHLDKYTEDWDIFMANDAQAMAIKIEAVLDERYDGNFFEVKPALHPGTFRVMNRVTGRPVADVTVPDRPIPFRRLMDGINYATLDYHVSQIKRTLALPENKFRWPKDSETLQRIEVYKATQINDSLI